jgi:hypothetical protein
VALKRCSEAAGGGGGHQVSVGNGIVTTTLEMNSKKTQPSMKQVPHKNFGFCYFHKTIT